MNLISTLRNRLFVGGDEVAPDEGQPPSGASSAVSGYAGLKDADVNSGLSRHTQVELGEIETYERSHRNRPAVLNKLRYLRGPEPIKGYDKLDVAGVSAALKDADVETIRAVREYERKFRRRTPVLEELARIGSERRSSLAADR